MFRGEKINVTENRAVLHVALRAPAERDDHGRRRERRAGGPRRARPDGRLRRPRPQRRVDGPHRQARSATSSTSASAAPTSARSWPTRRSRHYSDRDMTFRFVSNVDGTDFAEATRDLDPAETLFIVSSKTFTTLETMTNAHTARDWCLARAAATRRRSPSTSSPSPPTPRRSRSSASTPPTCSASGTGSAAATRWTRPSACRRCSPSGPTASARCSPASTRWTSTSAPRRSSETCPVLMGLLGVWYTRLLRRPDRRRAALRPVPQALPRLPAAAHDGEQRQARHARRRARSTTRHGADLLGRARHQRPALLLPAHPPGHAADPVRLHRLRPDAEPARRPPRPADGQRVRPGRGAGLRQDRRRGAGRGHGRGRSCRTASSRATARRTRSCSTA